MLQLDHISLAYAKHQALSDVSLRLDDGETVALLGANGAGKSSLLKAITGLAPVQSGTVRFRGRDIGGQAPHRIVESGISLVPEGRRLLAPLSLIENLMLGAYPPRGRGTEKERLAYVFGLFPRLAERKGQTVGTMSGGEQQMVAIGRALMANPAVLLLDEPSLGLSPRLTQELFAVLARIARDSGIGLMIVEQNARLALAMSDRAYLLQGGRIVGAGPASALAGDPEVARRYLGL